MRPGAVHLVDPADRGAHLAGLVTDTAFRGRAYELAVDLEGGGRLTGVQTEHRVNRGVAVGLRIDAAGCTAFPTDQLGQVEMEAPPAEAKEPTEASIEP
jgi:hypothetical protein